MWKFAANYILKFRLTILLTLVAVTVLMAFYAVKVQNAITIIHLVIMVHSFILEESIDQAMELLK